MPRAARRRSPANATARFYQIVARTRGQADRLSAAEADELMTMAQAAAARKDFHAANRIERFLDGGPLAGPGRRRRRRRREPTADAFEAEALEMLIETMMNEHAEGRGRRPARDGQGAWPGGRRRRPGRAVPRRGVRAADAGTAAAGAVRDGGSAHRGRSRPGTAAAWPPAPGASMRRDPFSVLGVAEDAGRCGDPPSLPGAGA